MPTKNEKIKQKLAHTKNLHMTIKYTDWQPIQNQITKSDKIKILQTKQTKNNNAVTIKHSYSITRKAKQSKADVLTLIRQSMKLNACK